MDRFLEVKKTVNSRMKCLKFMMVTLNVLYSIISFLTICGVFTLKTNYRFFWSVDTIENFSNLWMALACILLALSVLGIAAADKENTLMTNFYSIFLSIILILQVTATAMSFQLLSHSSDIVDNFLNNLINCFTYGRGCDTSDVMDWIQTTFRCCGNNRGPIDWLPYNDIVFLPHNYNHSWIPASPSILYSPNSTTKIPQSCCYETSNDNFEMICENAYAIGCQGPLYDILTESLVMISYSALIFCLVQIYGIFSAYQFARSIRQNKTNRDIQRWAVVKRMDVDKPVSIIHSPDETVKQ